MIILVSGNNACADIHQNSSASGIKCSGVVDVNDGNFDRYNRLLL